MFRYHEPSETLIVGDSLWTTDIFCIGDERLGLEMLRRFQPPKELAGLEPEQSLVGHGSAVTTHSASALREAVAGARWTFPRAVLENGEESIRAITAAMRA